MTVEKNSPPSIASIGILDGMNVERATPADALAVATIQVDAWRTAYAGIVSSEYLSRMSVERLGANWRRLIDEGNPTLLVARNAAGLAVGWLALGICRDPDAPPFQAEIWALNVAPAAWLGGVGKSLWLRARQILREAGFASCSLRVLEQNGQAIRFYRAIGFVPDDAPPLGFVLGGETLKTLRFVYPLHVHRPGPATAPAPRWT